MGKSITIGVIGDFDKTKSSHIVSNEALHHAARHLALDINVDGLPTPLFRKKRRKPQLANIMDYSPFPTALTRIWKAPSREFIASLRAASEVIKNGKQDNNDNRREPAAGKRGNLCDTKAFGKCEIASGTIRNLIMVTPFGGHF